MPAFPVGSFGTSQRPVRPVLVRAIVREEQYQRILGKPQPLQRRNDLADALVHLNDHLAVGRLNILPLALIVELAANAP